MWVTVEQDFRYPKTQSNRSSGPPPRLAASPAHCGQQSPKALKPSSQPLAQVSLYRRSPAGVRRTRTGQGMRVPPRPPPPPLPSPHSPEGRTGAHGRRFRPGPPQQPRPPGASSPRSGAGMGAHGSRGPTLPAQPTATPHYFSGKTRVCQG